MKTPILLIGGGGHCASVIDVIEAGDEYEIIGIVEAPGADTKSLLGYPVIGTDEHLTELLQATPHCVITVGQLESAAVRERLYAKVKQHGGILPTIISPLARVARSAKLGKGVVVMHDAMVNQFAVVGDNSIINNKALIEHGAQIGKHCHVATGALINGDAEVSDDCFIGSGAVLVQGVMISKKSVIGAGTVVIEHLKTPGVYVGCPAELKKAYRVPRDEPPSRKGDAK